MTQVYLRVFFVKYEGMYFRNGKSRVKRYKRELVYNYTLLQKLFFTCTYDYVIQTTCPLSIDVFL